MREKTSDAESNNTKYCGDHVIIGTGNDRKRVSLDPNMDLTQGYSTAMVRVIVKPRGFTYPNGKEVDYASWLTWES